jgi:hypothetical protein
LIPADSGTAVEVRMLDRIFDNYVQTPMQHRARRDPHAGRSRPRRRRRAQEMLDTTYGWLENWMAGRGWAAGDSFSLADCAAAPALLYADWVPLLQSRARVHPKWGMPMWKLLIRTLAALSLLVSVPARADCTDIDGDGFYREPGCGTREDCNDADPNAYPDAAETCDGYDDDCDGFVDNRVVCPFACSSVEPLGDPVLISDDSNGYYGLAYAQLASTPSGFGLAWLDIDGQQKVFFVTLDESGDKASDIVKVNNGSWSAWDGVSVAWTGTEHGVVWTHGDYSAAGSKIAFRRIDATGLPTGPPMLSEGVARRVTAVWTGAEYGIAWQRRRGFSFAADLYFTRLDSAGSVLGTEPVATSTAGSAVGEVGLAWSGDGFAVVWYDDFDGERALHFQRLDAAGRPRGEGVRLGDEYNPVWPTQPPEIVWTGEEYAVAWYRRFARLSATGDVIAILGIGGHNAITWTGSEYGLAWWDGTSGRFARLDPQGRIRQPPIRAGGRLPSVVWTGSEYAIAWTTENCEDCDEHAVYLTRIGCPREVSGQEPPPSPRSGSAPR